MKCGTSVFGLLGWMALLGLVLGGLSAPALAQKSGSGGGGGGASGGGSGGGGGNNNKTGIYTSTQVFDNWGIRYNGVLPLGQVTFTYSADGTTKTMNVQLSSINAPDGTVMTVETIEQWPAALAITPIFSYYSLTIHQGKGTLSLSTANGNSVMFLPPTVGQTNLYVFGPGNVPLMGARLGDIGG